MNLQLLGLLIFMFVMWIAGYATGRMSKKSDGIFLIDDRDPDKTKWTLDVQGEPADILKKKRVVFRVFVQK